MDTGELRQSWFTQRWYIVNSVATSFAWTGSRWAPHYAGIGRTIQISNFATREEAMKYANEMGIQINEAARS